MDSDPARSAVIHWFYSEEGQALFGDTDPDDVIFSVDPRDIAQELKLGNYDAAVCAPDQKALQLLGGYEDGTFRPNQNITRAQFAVILARLLSPELRVTAQSQNT